MSCWYTSCSLEWKYYSFSISGPFNKYLLSMCNSGFCKSCCSDIPFLYNWLSNWYCSLSTRIHLGTSSNCSLQSIMRNFLHHIFYKSPIFSCNNPSCSSYIKCYYFWHTSSSFLHRNIFHNKVCFQMAEILQHSHHINYRSCQTGPECRSWMKGDSRRIGLYLWRRWMIVYSGILNRRMSLEHTSNSLFYNSFCTVNTVLTYCWKSNIFYSKNNDFGWKSLIDSLESW